MLSYQTVEPYTLELLKRLTEEPFLSETRLVGGTALALQYGHRTSIDLDFFGSFPTDDDSFSDMLDEYEDVTILKGTRNIKSCLIGGVKVDFVNYKYPWIDAMITEDGLRLASPQDIAAMKVNAIEGRGTRKDFVDMYFLLQHYSLTEILDFYQRKYPEHSQFRALMSLSYFTDAEMQPMPRMFTPDGWEEMKSRIIQEVTKLAR